MDLEWLSGLPDEMILIWHMYRTEIILTAGLLLACVRLAIHYRKGRAKVAQTSPLRKAIDEEKDLETAPKLIKKELVGADHFEVIQSFEEKTPRLKTASKRVAGVRRGKTSTHNAESDTLIENLQPTIFYFSVGGSTKARAEVLAQSFLEDGKRESRILSPTLRDLAQIDFDDYFVTPTRPSSSNTVPFYILLIPSYDIDTYLSTFISHMQETHHDFRIDTAPLSFIAGYSVFGFGDREGWPTDEEGYCSQAVEVDKWMARLSARKRAFPLGSGDVKHDAVGSLNEWWAGVKGVMADLASGKGLGEAVPGSGDPVESGDEDEAEAEDDELDATSKTKQRYASRSRMSDLEDIKAPIPVDFTTSATKVSTSPKPMVPISSPTHASLTKQGYKIVGTHSGVKTCRWTKSALRGRGSCYKFSFYGIASHQCMEATPALSCSNKCVFCWRHGTNPVGTTWRWTIDEPLPIFQGIKENHYKMIKTMRGVPGVRAERFAEAMQIRHCALSLVGEPIFYPRINELLALLHGERISTFMVCNAQHPDQLAALDHVTQLYVSIDAPDKASLRRIDRPLHRDFWERFLRCMDILRARRTAQRTVFRLTLVKGFNADDAEGYADLVQRALPAFVEVKGVTYCGTSTTAGAGLSMANVPWYEEVTAFVRALEQALLKRGLDYGIAAEHAHSCCVLLADRARFFRRPATSEVGNTEKKWHTLIDYPRFFECLESKQPFGPEDYIGALTPEWALWGNGGFDPRDQRVDRKGRPKDDGPKKVVEQKVED